jgi:hypothetical protein
MRRGENEIKSRRIYEAKDESFSNGQKKNEKLSVA